MKTTATPTKQLKPVTQILTGNSTNHDSNELIIKQLEIERKKNEKLQLELISQQTKLNEQKFLIQKLSEEKSSATNKQTEIKPDDLVNTLTQEIIDNKAIDKIMFVTDYFIHAIAEDEYYAFIYLITHRSLNEKTQHGAMTHIKDIYETYKGLNEKILFSSESLTLNEHDKVYARNQLRADLEFRTKPILHPELCKLHFSLPSIEDANKKCSEFYFLTMKRIDSAEETSSLYKHVKRYAFLLRQSRPYIREQASELAKSMIAGSLQRFAPIAADKPAAVNNNPVKKTSKPIELVSATTATENNTLFKPKTKESAPPEPNTSYRSYFVAPFRWAFKPYQTG